MPMPGQSPEHGRGLAFVGRLAQNFTADGNDGVRAQHGQAFADFDAA